MNDPLSVFFSIMIVLVAFVFGWIFAHNTIADECEKLQSFYVGANVYDCKVRKPQ